MSACRLRDAGLLGHLRQVHADNYGVYGVYGVRKMWHALRRKRIAIGREQTARLMRMAGLSGKGKGFYKNELIHPRMWNDVVDVEIATFDWLNW